MLELNDLQKSVLERYSRPVVHMRYQVEKKRFGLVLGSGISRNLEIPNWKELVDKLAAHPDICGTELLSNVAPRGGLPYRTQLLFEHFRRRKYEEDFQDESQTTEIEAKIHLLWSKILRDVLYEKVSRPLNEYLSDHPYLEEFLPIIRNSQMTVTYNFDDFIEQFLLSTRTSDEAKISRGFESVVSLWAQFRRPNAIIYHPNGILPQASVEGKGTSSLIFSELSYAERLIGIFAGDQAALLTHFAKNTCLFIGISLEDETLRSVLLQSKRTCPGNFHYYIHYLKDGEKLSDEECQAIKLTNFKVYNLITLFLKDKEIKALAELIDSENCPSDLFCETAEANKILIRYKYYITGPLGVGKSMTIRDFGNLIALEEWLAPRFPLLQEHWKELGNPGKAEVDPWIAEQFKLKNDNARRAREGIVMLDRAPLDPLAFTPTEEWSDKAHNLLKTICPGPRPYKVEDGKVILLIDDVKRLALKMIETDRSKYTEDDLKEMEDHLKKAYGSDGVEVVDVRGWGRADVARRVAEIVHLEKYEPVCDLHARLEKFRDGGFNAVE